MDNIDVDYAKRKELPICFIIRISSRISFAHLFSGVRFLHDSNRTMPLEEIQTLMV
jgi:D-3-phosphoglycerate dehydrogenase